MLLELKKYEKVKIYNPTTMFLRSSVVFFSLIFIGVAIITATV